MNKTTRLLRFSLGQLLAGRRLIVVVLLVALPLVLPAVFAAGADVDPATFTLDLFRQLVLPVLLPVVALTFSTSSLGSELRDGTVTNLLLKPIPRPAVLGAKYLAAVLSSLLVLLGLPGLYGAESVRMGRLGLVGFLLALMGTMLVAVSGNFGFIAPVLAAESPATIDAINAYLPEVALNAVAFVGFVVGFIVFGMAMAKTATLPRSSGLLVAVGAPAQVVGFALAQTVSPAWWTVAVLGSVALGAGLAGLLGHERPPSSWLSLRGNRIRSRERSPPTSGSSRTS
jgi:ABC-type transport system involved in multi-copper enzyme maturation permease subunit